MCFQGWTFPYAILLQTFLQWQGRTKSWHQKNYKWYTFYTLFSPVHALRLLSTPEQSIVLFTRLVLITWSVGHSCFLMEPLWDSSFSRCLSKCQLLMSTQNMSLMRQLDLFSITDLPSAVILRWDSESFRKGWGPGKRGGCLLSTLLKIKIAESLISS